MNLGTPKPRGAEPTTVHAMVKGERTNFMGKSKMSIRSWPYLRQIYWYWLSANSCTCFISLSVPFDMAYREEKGESVWVKDSVLSLTQQLNFWGLTKHHPNPPWPAGPYGMKGIWMRYKYNYKYQLVKFGSVEFFILPT